MMTPDDFAFDTGSDDPNPEVDGLLKSDMPGKKKSPLEQLIEMMMSSQGMAMPPTQEGMV